MKNPLIPFLAITGSPSKEQIENHLQMLKKVGIDQFLLYPRSGCELEYLSEKWFETIGYYLEFAKQNQMQVWLYDEFNWPSGDAGGRITANPRYRQKAIYIKGEQIGMFNTITQHNANLFGEKYFPDILSEDVVTEFIEYTHEAYFKHFGAYFGDVIVGMFTDEPSPSYCSVGDAMPYYDGMKEDYAKQCGRNFDTDLKNGEQKFFEICFSLIAKRFASCYIGRLADWCDAHGIVLTGHLLNDDNPFCALRANGNLLRVLSRFPLPGVDDIFTHLDSFTLFGAAEYAAGAGEAMVELFGCGPCDMSYTVKRCQLFFASCFRIAHYFIALSPTDFRGNYKIKDYFNAFSDDQPDFAGNCLLREDAILAAELARKEHAVDVFIRYPVNMFAKDFSKARWIQEFCALVRAASYAQIQWRFLDEDGDPGDIPVIEMTPDYKYLLNGTEAIQLDTLCAQLCKEPVLTDEKGNVPNGIFMRRYLDGTSVILNLQGGETTCIYHGKSFLLKKHGVKIIYGDSVVTQKIEHRIEIEHPLRVTYDNDNVIRAMYINGERQAYIDTDRARTVRFAVRNDTFAALNGNELKTPNDASVLSHGFRPIYRVSQPMELIYGKNLLESQNDLHYLPSVFIIGDFSVETVSGKQCMLLLSERRSHYRLGEKFSDYGGVTFTATEVMIPQGINAISLGGTELYTRVYFNNCLIGEKISDPYIYPFAESYGGKTVTLKIVQYSSIGPIFGDTKYYDRVSQAVEWRDTPQTHKTEFGFTAAWVKL